MIEKKNSKKFSTLLKEWDLRRITFLITIPIGSLRIEPAHLVLCKYKESEIYIFLKSRLIEGAE